MSRGNWFGSKSGVFGMAVILTVLSSIAPAFADSDTTYFYCRRVQGIAYTDFALAVTGENITLQPHASPESPGVRIYHGHVTRVMPSGNIQVDFNTYSQQQFLADFPNALFTSSIFTKGNSGYARIYNGGKNKSKDTIMTCETKKIFF